MQNNAPIDVDLTRAPSLWRRLAAILYDSLLVTGLLFLAMALAVVGLGSVQGWDQFNPAELRHNPFYIAYLLSVPLVFFVGFWRRGGQTLGMRSWHIRVVTSDGSPVFLTVALLRFLTALLSWAALGLGFLWVLVDREQLAWHDRLSGTRLVMVRKTSSRSGR